MEQSQPQLCGRKCLSVTSRRHRLASTALASCRCCSRLSLQLHVTSPARARWATAGSGVALCAAAATTTPTTATSAADAAPSTLPVPCAVWRRLRGRAVLAALGSTFAAAFPLTWGGCGSSWRRRRGGPGGAVRAVLGGRLPLPRVARPLRSARSASQAGRLLSGRRSAGSRRRRRRVQ